MSFPIGSVHGSGTRCARGQARAAGAAARCPARGESRAAPAAGDAHRRERAPGRKARRGQVAHRGPPEADPGDRDMSTEEKTLEKGALTLSLLGREFRVACPDGEEKQLLSSADYLNRKLKEVRDTGKVIGNERIGIMAALNIAHEFMSNKQGATPIDDSQFRRRIAAMQ